MDTPKEKTYRAAFSPLFNCYVRIREAHTDSLGQWIFTCDNKMHGLDKHLFRQCELERFEAPSPEEEAEEEYMTTRNW